MPDSFVAHAPMNPATHSGERARLIRRFRWYQPTELMNARAALIGAAVVPFFNGPRHSWLLTYCILLVAMILFQGAWYWKLRLKELEGHSVTPASAWMRFMQWKRWNVILLAIAPVVAALQWLLSGGRFAPEAHFLWSAAALVFAVLEHVNYYHVQLTHDTLPDLKRLFRERRLKEAQLAKDLRLFQRDRKREQL